MYCTCKKVVNSSCECIMLLIQAVKSIIGEVFDDVSFEEFEEDSNVSQLCSNSYILASFPGPAQLSIACSTEKRGEPGIFSHVNMM